MNISFIQGIVSYPASGNLQGFLSKTGQYVSLVADNGHTDVAFAHGLSNYLLSESVSVTNAWGPLNANTDYWLYWDINTTTAVRSYGFTALAPIYSASRPINALPDQHWFDLSTKKMFVMQGVRWREVIRVFAAKVNNTTFSPLGSGYQLKPFAGTQVGLFAENTEVGRIISDNVGKPIRRSDGRFFTSMDDFFLDGSPVNAVRFESGIVIASAQTNMAKYQVVKYSDFAEILPAEYNDVETTVIALLMEDALFGSTVSVCIQGVVTNPTWNWPTVGQTLWVGAGGSLVSVDPHVTNPILYPVAKAPVGRVLSETSIVFDQGLGQKGEKGDPGSGSGGSVIPATNAVQGVVRLTVPAASSADPVVVGDNDPRNTNARVPLAHTQAATTITTVPYGTVTTGTTAAVQLNQLADYKVNRAGDDMFGTLNMLSAPITFNGIGDPDPQHLVGSLSYGSIGNLDVTVDGDVQSGLQIYAHQLFRLEADNDNGILSLGSTTSQHVYTETFAFGGFGNDNPYIALKGDKGTVGQALLSGGASGAVHWGTVSGGGGGDVDVDHTFIVQINSDNAYGFGANTFNAVINGGSFEWNLVQTTPQILRNSSNGYSKELVLQPATAYRIQIVTTFAMAGQEWPDGSTLVGTQITSGFGQASPVFITPTSAVHEFRTPSASRDTAPDGNTALAAIWPGTGPARSQRVTDTYIVTNESSNYTAAVKFNAIMARAGATLTPAPTANISMILTMQRLSGNFIQPS